MRVINKYVQYDTFCKMVNIPKNTFIFGLGDIIRGSISAYEICSRLNVPFSADFSDHPIREFLEGDSAISNAPIPLAANQGKELEAFLEKNRSAGTELVIYANCFPIYPISNDCKLYMQKVLQPKMILETAIENTFKGLGITKGKYICISIRMGDASFNENNSNESKYEQVSQKVLSMLANLPNGHEQHILVSDDKGICKYFAERFNFKVRNTKPCHLGIVQFGDENIVDTLVDFFILSRCATIVHYSVHHWISGFCHWTSNIFNIPLVAFTETRA